jgi:hypothetical protein
MCVGKSSFDSLWRLLVSILKSTWIMSESVAAICIHSVMVHNRGTGNVLIEPTANCDEMWDAYSIWCKSVSQPWKGVTDFQYMTIKSLTMSSVKYIYFSFVSDLNISEL